MSKEINDKQIAAIFKIRNDARIRIKKKVLLAISVFHEAYYRGMRAAASDILYLLDLSRQSDDKDP